MFFLIILLEVPGESHPQTGLAKLKSGIDLIRLVIEVVPLSTVAENTILVKVMEGSIL